MAKKLKLVKKDDSDGAEPPAKPIITAKTWAQAKRLYLEGNLDVAMIAEHLGLKEYQIKARIHRGTRHAVPWSRLKKVKQEMVQAAYSRTIEEHSAMVRKTKQLIEEKINQAVTAMLMNSDHISPDDLRKLMSIVESLDKIERLEEGKPTAHILTQKVSTADVLASLRDMGVSLNDSINKEDDVKSDVKITPPSNDRNVH